MFPKLFINEAIFLEFEGVQVEGGNDFGRKVILDKVVGDFYAGEGFPEEKIVWISDVAHREIILKSQGSHQVVFITNNLV
jgi:hypothetical protein